MKIAFIGYGSMARALGARWVGAHEIVISGRNRDKADALAGDLGCASSAEPQGVADADVVVLATSHEAVFDAMDAAGGAEALASKTLLDINNPIDWASGGFIPKTYDGRSLAEAIQDRAPDAHVVKAFNMCQATVWGMDPPHFDGRTLVTMHCGNNDEAKSRIATLIRDTGGEPLDIGGLEYARSLEAAAGLVIKLLFSGRDHHTVLNLIQPEVRPIGT